jgi:integrase
MDVCAGDLRRTFAKLAHKGGAPIDPIQPSLGHNSIQTTARYLGVDHATSPPPPAMPSAYGCDIGDWAMVFWA